jgi:hypothetical protein
MEASDHQQSSRFFYVIVRPLMLVFWILVLWGTVYAWALLYAAFVSGSAMVFRQALAGRDGLAGLFNVVLSACAAVMWITLAIGIWQRRRYPGPEENGHGQPPKS